VKGYAAGTGVPVERSRAEIDAVLTRNGASSVAILNGVATSSARGIHAGQGERASQLSWVDARLAQARRERWRQMLLLLKAKLEIVRIGFSTVEHEFMADMVLPSGETVSALLAEALRRGLNGTGDLPKLLGSGAP
jgi:hypothetical protein